MPMKKIANTDAAAALAAINDLGELSNQINLFAQKSAENTSLLTESVAKLGEKTTDICDKIAKTAAKMPKSARDEFEFEKIESVYTNPRFGDKIKFPTMYRMNQKGMRYYFTVRRAGEINPGQEPAPGQAEQIVTFFPSVTTIIKNTIPMGPGLVKMLGDMGKQEFDKMMWQKREYGTLLHILIADYLRSGNSRAERHFDLNALPDRIEEYAEENGLNFDYSDWKYRINKDLCSLIQFTWDCNVEPIAIETVGYWENPTNGQQRYAGAIDMICEMDIEVKGYFGEHYKSNSGEHRIGDPKETKGIERVTAIIDFKSGKSGFFDTYEMQLHMYKRMAEQTLGLKIDKVFNVAPKDWQTLPTYDIKDQTASREADKINSALSLFFVEWQAPKDVLVISGTINGVGDMTDVCKMIPAREFVLNKFNSYN